jgi:HPt (histidine-containing phosphotransfer) domain-containing protein
VDDHDTLQQKLMDLSNRYLQRTLGEVTRLRDLVEAARGGQGSAVKDIEQLAHKIYGSGSMFGFDSVSEHARMLELLAGENAGGPAFIERLETCAASLEERVRSAARLRGMQ